MYRLISLDDHVIRKERRKTNSSIKR